MVASPTNPPPPPNPNSNPNPNPNPNLYLNPNPNPNPHQVIKTPECVRVYIGSFWESPLQCNEWSKQLLQAHAQPQA